MRARCCRFHAADHALFIFLVVLGIFPRLIAISQPFVDGWSWREADVAMIARNFFRHGHKIFYPQIDWAGTFPGYVGTEFQLVPFLASVLYPVVGMEAWIGRSISVLFFAASVPFFYLLTKKIFSATTALFAVGIYSLVPLSIFAGRSFMPDMASLSFSIAALYLFSEWLERRTAPAFFAAVVTTSLAILVKAPAAVIGVPLFYMAWVEHRWRVFVKPKFWLFAALTLAGPVVWYVHTYFVGNSQFPHDVWFMASRHRLRLGITSWSSYGEILQFTAIPSLTPVVTAAAAIGLFFPPRAKFAWVFHWWFAALVMFVIVAGEVSMHPWYQLPVVPVAAAFGAAAWDWAVRKVAPPGRALVPLVSSGLALLTVTGALSYAYVRDWYTPWAVPLQQAGLEVDRIAPADALVVFVDDGNPAGIYYSGRKGWHFLNRGIWWGNPADSRQAINELENLKAEGAAYLIFTKYTAWWLDYYQDFRTYLDLRYRRVKDTGEYIIFDLGAVKRRATT